VLRRQTDRLTIDTLAQQHRSIS